QQQEGGDQMRRHHNSAVDRLVVGDQLEQDQPSPNGAFQKGEEEGKQRRLACRVPLGVGEESADDQRQDERQQEARGESVTVLDDRLQLAAGYPRSGCGYELPAAVRPVAATAIAGHGGSDKRPAEDYGDVVDQQTPCVLMEPQSRHQSMYRSNWERP